MASTPQSQFPTTWTLPNSGDHPRIFCSNRFGSTTEFCAPTVQVLRNRIASSHSTIWSTLRSYCNSVVGNSNASFQTTSSEAEQLGALAFVYLLDNTATNFADKAISVALNTATLSIPSSTFQKRHRLLQMAYVYDWAYARMSSSQRTTLRNRIAFYLEDMYLVRDSEFLWGVSHGDIEYATIAACAILGDGSSSENSTWNSRMDSTMNARDNNTPESFFAGFRHFGNDDGGTHKGSCTYDKIQEEFYMRVFPALRTAVNQNLWNTEPWFMKMPNWMLWHFTNLNHGYHRQSENGEFAPHRMYTQTHCYQVAAYQKNVDRVYADHCHWLATQIDNLGNADITQGRNLLRICFEDRSLGSGVQPTIARVGNVNMRWFKNAGKVCIREGWNANDQSIAISAQRYFTGGHSRRDDGHFELFSNSRALCITQGHYDAGEDTTYKVNGSSTQTGHRYSYMARTLAMSVCRIFDTNEPSENPTNSFQRSNSTQSRFGVLSGGSVQISNDGGQLWPKALGTYQPFSMLQLTGSQSQSVWVFSPFPINPVETAQYCYVVLDITRRYYAQKCFRYRRHFLWVKPGQIPAWTKGILLIWDDLDTHTDPAGNKTSVWQLQTQVTPSGTNANDLIYTDNRGGAAARLFLKVLNPAATQLAIVSGSTGVGGNAYKDIASPPVVFSPTDTNSTDDSNGGVVRTEVNRTTFLRNPDFLAVLYPNASSIGAAPATTLVSDASFIGATIGGVRVDMARGANFQARVGTTGDTTPPPAPTNLIGTAGNGQIVLNWDDSPASDFANFRVYRALLQGGVWGAFAQVATPVPSAYTDTGVINGSTYRYQVTAVDGIPNESLPSNQTPGITPGPPPDLIPPDTPTGLTAVAGNAQVVLDWNDNGEADLGGYRVYRQAKSGATYLTETLVASTAVSNYTDTTAANGTTYHYRISAIDTASIPNESTRTAYTADVTPVAPDTTPPDPPTGVSATPGDAQVLVDWNDNGESDLLNYQLYREQKSGDVFDAGVLIQAALTTSSYLDVAVVNGSTYRYRLTATDNKTPPNVSAFSAYSPEATPVAVTPPGDTTPPQQPTGLVATPGNGIVTLDWNDNGESDFSFYRVYREIKVGGVFVNELRIASPTPSAYVDDTVVNGQTYRYTVTAVDNAIPGNESAKSNFSAEVTPTAPVVDTTPPAMPTGLSAVGGNAIVTLNWNDNVEGDLAGYRVYRQLKDGATYRTELRIATPTASAFIDGSVTNGLTYRYRVSAVDNAPVPNESTPTAYTADVTPAGTSTTQPLPWKIEAAHSRFRDSQQ